MLLVASLLALVPPGVPAQGAGAGPAPASSPEPGADLSALLDRMDRAASLYRQAALKFSCRETLRTDGGKILRYEYLYVIGEDGTFRDYRTRVGDSQALEIGPTSIPVRHSLVRAYSWVFLFGRDFRRLVRYRLLGSAPSRGRESVLVGFEPIPPTRREINDWSGTAWVEPATGRILRIEAKGADDLAVLRAAEAVPPPAGDGPRRRFLVRSATTEFGIEKNDMRLPSQAIVEIEEHLVPGRGGLPSSSRVIYRTVQNYTNYRFFGVNAEEKHPLP
jgi:hypothetical protein